MAVQTASFFRSVVLRSHKSSVIDDEIIVSVVDIGDNVINRRIVIADQMEWIRATSYVDVVKRTDKRKVHEIQCCNQPYKIYATSKNA